MMIPVFVCVPSAACITDENGVVPSPSIERVSAPIGWLRGFEADDLDDDKMVDKELAAVGLKLRYHLNSVKCSHGQKGCLLSFAIEVDTYEDAEKLPGFEAFGYWTGGFYPPPVGVVMKPEEGTIQKFEVKDYYDNFVAPPYKEDGSFVCSLIPYGQIGEVWFLREEPLYFFATMDSAGDESQRRARVRQFSERMK